MDGVNNTMRIPRIETMEIFDMNGQVRRCNFFEEEPTMDFY